MITLKQEFYAFEALINANLSPIELLAEAKKKPTAKEAVFLLVDGGRDEINRAMLHRERSYQLIFYETDSFLAMDLHSKVEELFSNISSLPCEGRFIKLTDVTLSRIFTTDSGLHSFLCMVEASYSQPRSFQESPKMASINATVTKK